MLTFKDLTISYQDTILEKISGTLENGKIVFLVGPNGSGKTSLLKALGGILQKKEGTLKCQETPIYLAAQFTAQSGLSGHDLLDLYEAKKSTWYEKYFLQDPLCVQTILKRPLESLSSGEKKRVLLSATLFHKSYCVLLDEPTAHLDLHHALSLKNWIQEQASCGRSFLISNHDLHWAFLFQNTQTWVLFEKSIVLRGSTQDVFRDIKLKDILGVKAELVPHRDGHLISLSYRE